MSNMVVQTNVLSLNSHRNLKNVGTTQSKASQRLSSGYKINSAADDAAGLAISEKMRAQIRGLDMASKNTQDATSLIQTAEGGMQEVDNMLQRVRELVTQSSNDTNENNATGTGDRQKIQDEIDQLIAEIDKMGERTEFNKKKLINGSFADTQGTLANAKKSLDAAASGRSAAGAKLTAVASEEADARQLLGIAQDAITDPNGAQDTFDTANTAYITAKVSYDSIVKTYDEAVKDLNNVLGELQLVNVAGLHADALDGSSADGIKDPSLRSKLEAALNTYAEAAEALGYDGLDLQNAAVNGASTPGFTPINGANAPTLPTDLTKGAKAQWVTDQETFATAKAAYDTAILARDKEQWKLDGVLSLKEEANGEFKKANQIYNAAITTYNAAEKLVSNGASKSLYFQVGSNAQQGLEMSIGSVKSDMLGIGDGMGNSRIDLVRDTGADTTAILETIDTALSYITTERAKLGAAQNRLEYTSKSLDISSENLSSAESRIRDTDMAKEMMQFTKSNVLQQASISMLAQANQAPQSVLKLLG